MKKSKLISSILAVALSVGAAFSFFGCKKPAGDSGNSGVDASKTQLYVRNYQGGFGNKWLYNGKDKLEAKYAGVELETGKKGVQVMITDVKETPDSANIQNDAYEVYFVEKVQYLYLEKQGVLEDITGIVTGTNPYDGKSIESKLTEEQKAFYGIEKDGKTKYYALPHYMTSMGIVYDIDLFEDRGFYFADGYENETSLDDKFVVDEDSKRSAGPDGIPGNEDDGLPATYEDFWDLCEYISRSGYTPLNWGGTNAASYYITTLMAQLMANYQGKTEYMRNFTMDGELSEVVKLDSDGNVVMSNGAPETESVTLDPAQNNGYETYRTAAYYYGLQFVSDLMKNSDKYAISANVSSKNYDAFKAQKDYVASRFASNMKRQAMLIDGSYWDSEATPYFEKNEALGGAKENCRYGWLPLPNATREQVGKNNNTMVNIVNSLCFVKKGLNDVKKQLAFDFVQLMNSDESLVDFTVQTNAFKDFEYEIKPEQVAKLSPFGREIYKAWTSYDKVNPIHNNTQFYNTIYTTDMARRFAISTKDSFPALVFASSNKTPAGYLAESYKYMRQNAALWNEK